jgi:hypothetical protein
MYVTSFSLKKFNNNIFSLHYKNDEHERESTLKIN